MRQRFGDFYSFGLPGLGSGLFGTVYVIQDPHVMAGLLRQEGPHPSGAAESSFAFGRFLQQQHSVAQYFFAPGGPEWKRVRTFVQSDLLSPTSSERYLPAICQAAAWAAQGVPSYAHTNRGLNDFLVHASFDMFSNLMMGQCPRLTDPNTTTDAAAADFCHHVSQAFSTNTQLMRSPWQKLCVQVLGLSTQRYRHFERHWQAADAHARQQIQALVAKDPTTLTELERNSYTMTALQRAKTQQQDQDDNHKNTKKNQPTPLTLQEAESLVPGFLAAGVDTTANNASWKLLHLAFSPEAQERIYLEQLHWHGGSADTLQVTPESVLPRNAPYLHACIRESHRLANPAPLIPHKRFPNPVMIHGVEIPARTNVILDSLSTGVQPEYWQDYNPNKDVWDFDPERFLPAAIQARQGTRSEIVDHAFFKGPFSQGARKCPGSRVAQLELAALLANLAVQWEWSIAADPQTGQVPYTHWTHVPYGMETLTTAYLPAMDFVPRRNTQQAL